jgi:ComF family protein
MKEYAFVPGTARGMVSDVGGLLYPNLCFACNHSRVDEQGAAICFRCRIKMPETSFHLDDDNYVARHFWGRVPIRHASSLWFFQKGGRVQRLLFQLKYKGKTHIGEEIGRMYGSILKEEQAEVTKADLIIPVPLHYKKLRIRGYNQCDPFASGLSEAMNIPWSDNAVKRVFENSTQTKKGRIDRWENVRELFALRDIAQVSGKHIILVDDVVTTGATLESCTKVLINNTNAQVSILTIAVAQ